MTAQQLYESAEAVISDMLNRIKELEDENQELLNHNTELVALNEELNEMLESVKAETYEAAETLKSALRTLRATSADDDDE